MINKILTKKVSCNFLGFNVKISIEGLIFGFILASFLKYFKLI